MENSSTTSLEYVFAIFLEIGFIGSCFHVFSRNCLSNYDSWSVFFRKLFRHLLTISWELTINLQFFGNIFGNSLGSFVTSLIRQFISALLVIARPIEILYLKFFFCNSRIQETIPKMFKSETFGRISPVLLYFQQFF